MILTLCEVLVMLGLPAAVGGLAGRLLAPRKTLTEDDWIGAPFLGASAIILTLQAAFYAGAPVGLTALPLLVACGIAALLLSATRTLRARWGQPPLDLFGAAAAVFLFHGLGLLRVGADRYLARALGDQFSYVSMAEYIVRRRYGAPLATDWPFHEWIGAAYSTHRIGEAVLQAFLAVVAPGSVKTWFEPLIIWSVFLLVLALFAIARAMGLSRRAAIVTAVAASVMPAVAYIHLESFLSQALAVPFLFQTLVLAARARERGTWQDYVTYGLVSAGTAAIYFEFAPFLIVTAVLLLVSTLVARSSRTWRRLALGVVGLAMPLLLNDARSLLNIAASVAQPVLGFMYPWALSIEGLQRLWLGDFGSGPSLVMSPFVRGVALTATAAGFAGLAIALRNQLRLWRPDDEVWQGRLLLGLLVTGVAALPLLVIVKDGDHPYQAYKLWLSVAPLLACGMGVLTCAIAARLRAWPRAARLVPATALVLASVSAVATADMVVASSRSGPDDLSRRQTTVALRDDFAGAERFLAATRAKDVVLCSTAPVLSGYANAWLTYFARHQRAWPLNPVLNGHDLRAMVAEPDYLRQFPETLETGSVVLTTVDGGLWAEGSETSLVWAQGAYTARATIDRPSAFLCHNTLRPEPSGRTATVTIVGTLRQLPIVSSVAQTATLMVHAADPASDALLAQLHFVVNGTAVGSDVAQDGTRIYAFALRPGLNRAQWRLRVETTDPMERWPAPSFALTGVHLMLGHAWTTLEAVDNPNGLERVDGDPFFWLGKGQTVVSLIAGQSGAALLKFEAVPGPSRSEPTRRVRITTANGYDRTVAVGGGPAALDVPLVPGRQEIRLQALDPPLIHLAHDPRPLLLGVRRLTVAFAPPS
jgi:hypothetical protein